MKPLELVGLEKLMSITSGSPDIKIGLIDGPVDIDHPDFSKEHILEISKTVHTGCKQDNSAPCIHGTLVAGILCAKRESLAPSICPNCTLIIRPIFTETNTKKEYQPVATSKELIKAMIECIDSGIRIINLSLILYQSFSNEEYILEEVLNYAAKRDVIVVAASGNQRVIGSSIITRHPWVIPVVACDNYAQPTYDSNMGHSIARRGLCAPGKGIISLSSRGHLSIFNGTSVATPFVTGTIALLWSIFPDASATEIKSAVIQSWKPMRQTIIPPLLNADETYKFLKGKLDIKTRRYI